MVGSGPNVLVNSHEDDHQHHIPCMDKSSSMKLKGGDEWNFLNSVSVQGLKGGKSSYPCKGYL